MPVDTVVVEAFGTPGTAAAEFNFQDFTSFALSTSMIAPAEASFELGDETGWGRLSELVAIGAEFRVFVDDRIRLTGRVEQLNSSLTEASMTQAFVVRTRLSDAIYSSAPQGLRLKGVSVRDFVLALYEPLGIFDFDFDFRGDFSRDLLTGRPTRGGRAPLDLEPLKDEEAKVQPPESIYAAADRHLRRHGLMHWDGPDGKIVVAAPDDEQEPIAQLRSFKGTEGQINNVLSIDRAQDVGDAPTVLGLFGSGGQASFTRAKVSAVLFNADLIRAGFQRSVVIIDEAMRRKQLADRRAAREFATRSRGLDRLTVTVDGLSFRDGPELIPWAPDTTVDVVAEQLGGALGVYYVEDVQMARNASTADQTRLTLVRKGVWTL